jgi:hypothetical protein
LSDDSAESVSTSSSHILFTRTNAWSMFAATALCNHPKSKKPRFGSNGFRTRLFSNWVNRLSANSNLLWITTDDGIHSNWNTVSNQNTVCVCWLLVALVVFVPSLILVLLLLLLCMALLSSRRVSLAVCPLRLISIILSPVLNCRVECPNCNLPVFDVSVSLPS